MKNFVVSPLIISINTNVASATRNSRLLDRTNYFLEKVFRVLDDRVGIDENKNIPT